MIELPSPCLVVLVGPAASGKSTWATAHLAGHVVSTDSLRALVGEGEDDLRASADAFAVLDDIVARRLRRSVTTVIDSLGTDPHRRAVWRRMARDTGTPCVAILFDVAPAQLRRQNRARAKVVPAAVLARQISQWPAIRDAVFGEPFDAVHHAEVATIVPPELVGRDRLPSSIVATPSSLAIPSVAVTPSLGTAGPGRRAPMKFGLQIPQFSWPGGPSEIGARVRAIAERAEAVGFDSLWVMDHFRQIPQMGPAWADMLESWTTLAHLAACTQRIRLGTLVSGITYRNVAHLAKIVATLDVLSAGRANCGIGLAWFADEHRAYGWPFPDRKERYALLADALELLPKMWGPGGKPFAGRVLNVPDTSCYPRPLQSRIPILVGGSGEKRTLALVARAADACNLFGDAPTVARRVEVLRDHCADVGRDIGAIEITHLSTVLVGKDPAHVSALVGATKPARVSAERHARAVNAGTVGQHVERLALYAQAGVQHAIVSLADLADTDAVDRYGEVIAHWQSEESEVRPTWSDSSSPTTESG